MKEKLNHNFITAPGQNAFYKIAPQGDSQMHERLMREAQALSMVLCLEPDLAPEARIINIDGIGTALKLNCVDGLKSLTTFSEYAYVINKLQKIPLNDSLPHLEPSDYKKRADEWMAYLRAQGAGVGLTQRETQRIEAFYEPCLDSLSYFRKVFVHTDIQNRHVGSHNGKPVIIDFDQAHFGNELEDWAFLSIRHQRFEADIMHYLTVRMSQRGINLDNLDKAFSLLKVHFLLKAYYDRTYQSRGKIFDKIAKVYARQKLLTSKLKS